MPRLLLFACLALAACGADGAPEPPTKSGISVTGEAQVGVVIK
jgi:hypothetical protein